jgi:hypothetical protein
VPAPIHETAAGLDLSPRVFVTTTTIGSPANQTEAVVARVTVAGDVALVLGVVLIGWLAIRVGTSGTSLRMRVRQTGLGGTVLADTDAVTEAAGSNVTRFALGLDQAAVLPQVYALTSQTADAVATSTVLIPTLVAIAV